MASIDLAQELGMSFLFNFVRQFNNMRFPSRRAVNSNPLLVSHVLCAETRLNSRFSERLSLWGDLPTIVFILDQS
jgi:hypothetical protein